MVVIEEPLQRRKKLWILFGNSEQMYLIEISHDSTNFKRIYYLSTQMHYSSHAVQKFLTSLMPPSLTGSSVPLGSSLFAPNPVS